MRKYFLILFWLCLVFFSDAQTPFGNAKNRFEKPKVYVLLNGGAIYSEMKLSDDVSGAYGQEPFFTKTAGIGLRVHAKKRFSVIPQFAYHENGIYLPEYQDSKMTLAYLNFYLPFEFDISFWERKKKTYTSLLWEFGPYAGKNVGGKLVNKVDEYEVPSDYIEAFDYGFQSGIGVRIPTYAATSTSYLTFKVHCFTSLQNNIAQTLPQLDDAEKERFLLQWRERISRGICLTVTYDINLESKKVESFTAGGDGKKTYKRFLVK